EKVSALLHQLQPEQVFVPYYQDGPPDHEASTRVVLASLRRLGRPVTVYEYPVWFWHHWPWTPRGNRGREGLNDFRRGLRAARRFLRDFRCSVRVEDVLEQKRAALGKHKSQVEQLVPDPAWTTLGAVADGEFLACFFQ